MRICQPHWTALRQGIEDRGLSGLVAGDGRRAVEALQRQSEGSDTPQDFDPLMSANLAIWSKALEIGGLYLLGEDEQGNHYCPLCEAEAHGGPGTAEMWINGCLDVQLAHARDLKLVPGIQ